MWYSINLRTSKKCNHSFNSFSSIKKKLYKKCQKNVLGCKGNANVFDRTYKKIL